jgi:hypothetical protein
MLRDLWCDSVMSVCAAVADTVYDFGNTVVDLPPSDEKPGQVLARTGWPALFYYLPYFPAQETHRPRRCIVILLEIVEKRKNNDERILVLISLLEENRIVTYQN